MHIHNYTEWQFIEYRYNFTIFGESKYGCYERICKICGNPKILRVRI